MTLKSNSRAASHRPESVETASCNNSGKNGQSLCSAGNADNAFAFDLPTSPAFGLGAPTNDTSVEETYNNKRMRAMQEISQHLQSELTYFREHSLRRYTYSLKRYSTFFTSLITNPAAANIKAYYYERLFENWETLAPDSIMFDAIQVIVSYYNKIYRLNESDTVNHAEINESLLVANLLKDQLYSYIRQHHGKEAHKIESITRDLFVCYELFNFFNIDKAAYFTKDLLNKAKELLTKKLDRPAVRSSFAFWMYQYVLEAKPKEEKIKDHDPAIFRHVIPFLAETAMTIMYYHNQVLDQKGGVIIFDEMNKVKTNLASANLLKELLYNYIDEKTGCNQPDKNLLTDRMRLIFSCVDVGQLIDKKVNNFKNFEDENFKYHFDTLDLFSNQPETFKVVSTFLDIPGLLQNIKKEIEYDHLKNPITALKTNFSNRRRGRYFDLYFDRIFLTSGALFKITTQTMLEMLGVQDVALRNCAISNAVTYGMMLQVVNDNNDFVKIETGTIEKRKDDVLCDLKNGTLSLPLIIYFTINRNLKTIVHRYIGNPQFKMTNQTIKEIQKALFESRALDCSIAIAKQMVREQKGVYWFKKTPDKEIFLRDIYSIAFYNKYLTEIQLQEKDLYKSQEIPASFFIEQCKGFISKGKKTLAGASSFSKSLFNRPTPAIIS